MKTVFLSLFLMVISQPLFAQGAPPHSDPGQPYIMEYYYKVQWGHQQEFLQLFLKNHYRVTIRFKNSTVATTATPDEDRLSSNSA